MTAPPLRPLLFMLLAAGLLLAPAPARGEEEGGGGADQQFVFAYRLLERGEREAAAEAFEAFLDAYPRDPRRPDARYYRALIAHQAGRHAQARDLLEGASEPTRVPAHLFALLRARLAWTQEDAEAVLARLEPLETGGLEPATAASIELLRGLAYRKSGNPTAAVARFEAITGLEVPLVHRAHFEIGRTRREAGDADKALAAFARAAEAPDRELATRAALAAGHLARRIGRHDEAAEHYRRVVSSHQSSRAFPEAVVGLLWARRLGGRHHRVLELGRRHLRQLEGRHRAEALYVIGSTHADLEQHEDALEHFEKSRATAPLPELESRLLYRRALAHQALGDTGAMRSELQALRRRFPDSNLAEEAAYRLAATEPDPEAAIRQLAEIITAGPDHAHYATALRERARRLDELGRLEAAARDLTRYLESAGEKPEAAGLFLLDLLHRLGRHDELALRASELLELTRDPRTRAEARYRRAVAAIRLDRLGQAETDLTHLLEEAAETALPPTLAGSAHYYRGLIHLARERPEAARKDLAAAAGDEGLPAAQRTSAWRLLHTAHRQDGDHEKAARALRAAERVAAGSLDAGEWAWLAEHALEAGDPDQAARDAEAALEAGAEAGARARALVLAGRAHRAAGRPAAALPALKEAIAIGTGVGLEARLALAGTLAEAGRPLEALTAYDELLGARRSGIAARALYESAALLEKLAAERRKAADLPAAREHRQEAVRRLKRLVLLFGFEALEPLPQKAHVALARLQARTGALEAAGKTLEELAEKYPGTGWDRLARALGAELAGNEQEAREQLGPLTGAKPEAAPVDRALAAAARALEARIGDAQP